MLHYDISYIKKMKNPINLQKKSRNSKLLRIQKQTKKDKKGVNLRTGLFYKIFIIIIIGCILRQRYNLSFYERLR